MHGTESHHHLSGSSVPDLNHAIRTGRCNSLSIRAERHIRVVVSSPLLLLRSQCAEVQMREALEVVPLERTKVGLARTRLSVLVQQVLEPLHMRAFPGS